MVKDYTFSFVVLHYQTISETMNCVASIQKAAPQSKIVLVDNASPNKSGLELQRVYKELPNIYCLLLESNIGFARGNNAGYKYARETLHSDFIICINNDTIIEQLSFVKIVSDIFNSTNYHVLGPDVYNPITKIHQNPLRLKALSKKEIKRQKLNSKKLRIIILIKYILAKVKLRPYKTNKEYVQSLTYKDAIQNNDLVLNGACLIFSPSFVSEQDSAFYDGTFMYMEEDFLRLKCTKHSYTMRYDPSVQILHTDGCSTEAAQGSQYKKDKFSLKETGRSRKLLLKEISKI